MTKSRFKNTPDPITNLLDNEIFVFGSNLEGFHEGGAARTAYEYYGAEWGQGIGHFGQSYAIPTLYVPANGDFLEKIDLVAIQFHIQDLYKYAKLHPELVFYVTKIGCGIAGFTIDEMKSIFIKEEVDRPENVILPGEFENN